MQDLVVEMDGIAQRRVGWICSSSITRATSLNIVWLLGAAPPVLRPQAGMPVAFAAITCRLSTITLAVKSEAIRSRRDFTTKIEVFYIPLPSVVYSFDTL
jgi:hypothetical protein